MRSIGIRSEDERTRKRILILLIFIVLIVLTFVISVNIGAIRLAPSELLQTIIGNGTAQQELILFEFRLPRIIISMLVGAGLAVSGCILQGVARNPLAEPGILGITTGAGLMVVLALAYYPVGESIPVGLLPFLSLIGGISTAIIIYMLAYDRHNGLLPNRLVLNGIAVAAGLNAILLVVSLQLPEQKYDVLAVWMAGRIWGAEWRFVFTLLPWMIILLPYIFLKARTLDVLTFGDEVATGLGVSVEKERLKVVAASVGLASACISVSGGIAFVGLIGPHLARKLIGPNHRFLLPLSAVAGALLLLAADTIGKAILQPSEIPAGIVVAIIGAPYFLYLLSKS
ncbi:iron ABC transporter permease [Virgibacillus sp. AGTR]|uniref:FecCD family ABC transporter permease n=1 Tax=Virgibacillus TaxID=84406 RepID=UPI001963392A|nr:MULTISPECIES: iron ABC transporter permease [Virgibacillus]MCC2250139.1 iron ABC transporter permease [Virgibacillus sp. AGTR]QRZ19021.1 iron ABC transporter permease [Virgibacillus sp. AGTR]WBX81354.1 iron ABC transporter permease [Virgibacillus salarius]